MLALAAYPLVSPLDRWCPADLIVAADTRMVCPAIPKVVSTHNIRVMTVMATHRRAQAPVLNFCVRFGSRELASAT